MSLLLRIVAGYFVVLFGIQSAMGKTVCGMDFRVVPSIDRVG
jgi:hypothetical protein